MLPPGREQEIARRVLFKAIRTNRITKRTYVETLPYLVQKCGICGEKATRRYGVDGRCDEHAAIETRAFARRRSEMNRVRQKRLVGSERVFNSANATRGAVDAAARKGTRP